MRTSLGALGVAFALIVVLVAAAGPAIAQRPPAVPAPAGDKRDRVVAAPGTPFHGKSYWQSAAQCGGTYFKIGAIYSDGAITAKVIKPDPAAYTRLTRSAESATRAATAFYEVAERFLMPDRKVTREEAVLLYDPLAAAAGDRVKTLDAAQQAAKPCAELYETCRAAFPQICNDANALTN